MPIAWRKCCNRSWNRRRRSELGVVRRRFPGCFRCDGLVRQDVLNGPVGRWYRSVSALAVLPPADPSIDWLFPQCFWAGERRHFCAAADGALSRSSLRGWRWSLDRHRLGRSESQAVVPTLVAGLQDRRNDLTFGSLVPPRGLAYNSPVVVPGGDCTVGVQFSQSRFRHPLAVETRWLTPPARWESAAVKSRWR